MGVNWASGLIRWKPHLDRAGRQYSLSHLHPFRYELALPEYHGQSARTVAIHVGFAIHVFTCKLAEAEPDADPYVDDREIRWFDLPRYQASFRLEAIIRDLENRRCYFAKNENFVTVEGVGAPPGYEYRVFFIARRNDNERDSVRIVVQSAYFGELAYRPSGQARKPVGFRVIISSALLGGRPREPA